VNQSYFQKLLDLYFDGNLEGEELEEFEKALRSSAGNRSEFWFQARLHGKLHDYWKHQDGFQLATPKTRRMNVFMAIAASLAAVCGVMIWRGADRTGEEGRLAATHQGETAFEPSVAMVSEALGVTWKSGVNLGPNSVVRPGVYEMTTGTLVIDFYSGARVTMKAPASFAVVSEKRFRDCGRGPLATRQRRRIPVWHQTDAATRHPQVLSCLRRAVHPDGGPRVDVSCDHL
jgi:hypothetical protein